MDLFSAELEKFLVKERRKWYVIKVDEKEIMQS